MKNCAVIKGQNCKVNHGVGEVCLPQRKDAKLLVWSTT